MKNELFTTFPHTADLGVEVIGQDLPQLFENAAIALFNLMTDSENINTIESVDFAIQADDRELLLREWLGELLYYSISRHYLFKSFRIKHLEEGKLQATATGESFNPQRHILKRKIKSVTYHALQIKKRGKGWQARFVLDI